MIKTYKEADNEREMLSGNLNCNQTLDWSVGE